MKKSMVEMISRRGRAALASSASVTRAQPGTEAEYRAARQQLEHNQAEAAVATYRTPRSARTRRALGSGLAVATNPRGRSDHRGDVRRAGALGREGDPWLARNRDSVENYARQFWPLVGRLIITDAAGVEVWVDGARVATTPMSAEGVVVASGERRVELRSTTHEDQTLSIRVAASDYDVTPEIQLTRRAVTMTRRAVRMVARILVTANVEGAAIFIDEEYVATAPLSAPIEVALGERRVLRARRATRTRSRWSRPKGIR